MSLPRKEYWQRLIPKNAEIGVEQVKTYKGVVDYTAAGAYGSAFVDWSKKPEITESESGFLSELEVVAQQIADGNMARVDEIITNLSTVFNPETYLPDMICGSEVAVIVGLVANQIASLRRNNRLNEFDILGRRNVSHWVRTVTYNLRDSWVDRSGIAWAMAGLATYVSTREKRIGIFDAVNRIIHNSQ